MFFKSAHVALLLFLAPVFLAVAGDGLPVRKLSVTGLDGAAHEFAVEVASKPSEREKGLMLRDFMEQGSGMLFTFPHPRQVTMWMKDTHIALDMLFIDSKHKVIHVKHNAKPMDEALIDSGGEVSHVLEINAGLAERLKISEGSRVSGDALEIKSSQ